MPKTGTVFGWGGYRFEVAAMDGRRVDKVLVNAVPDGRHRMVDRGRGL